MKDFGKISQVEGVVRLGGGRQQGGLNRGIYLKRRRKRRVRKTMRKMRRRMRRKMRRIRSRTKRSRRRAIIRGKKEGNKV